MARNHMSRFGIWVGLLAMFTLTLAVGLAAASAGSVAGDWQGTIDTGAGTLRAVIHISQDKDGKLSGTFYSPDQDASGLAISNVTYKEPDFHFDLEMAQASYDGKLNKDSSEIVGNFKQGGGSAPLTFKRIAK
jgi:hypothetical protein